MCGNYRISDRICSLCVGDYATVFPLFTCRDYAYEAERKIAVVEENFFDDQPWYVRLILEGEDRLWRNRETREHNNCVSYSCISEEWCELADKGQCLLEKIIAEETVRELMDLLTERQRQMIQRIYFQQKTQKEVSHELGITVPAVSKCISQAMQKMRNNSDNSARALEKGRLEVCLVKSQKGKTTLYAAINDTLVEVTREVYLAWYQAGRKERYQVEKCRGMGYAAWRNYRKKRL